MKKRTEKRAERKQRIECAKRRIEYRLRDIVWGVQETPMFKARNIQYEVAERDRGFAYGGMGLIHRMVREIGLVEAIDENLKLLKVHLPYHESDHVLNIAYNSVMDGDCLEDIELRRNVEVFLNALGAQRIPDPTTAGDFCRRFAEEDVETLMWVINETRLKVWKKQPKHFFKEAIIEGDGTIAATTGSCKQGMDISYNGIWGYHPLVISLANTAEPLFLVNRSGNRPSQEGAAVRFDQAAQLCRRAGFVLIKFRGDTDFSQTRYLDRWDEQGVKFIFGFDVVQPLVDRAETLPESAWERLERPPKYERKTEPRERPENVKERIVKEREFENIHLDSEHVAEFEYTPSSCKKSYRIVVCRKNLSIQRGVKEIVDDIRYFFYITNEREPSASEVVFEANDRCNQENLIAQLKSGVRSMKMPVDNLVSNWAYMVMAALAWSLKAWLALLLPEGGRWAQKHKQEKTTVLKMEFKKFINSFVRIPAQIVKTGRRIIYRLLAWNPFQHVFMRAVEVFEYPLRC
jgi:hypothetical protein